jgi:hypothetical protein
MQIHMRGKCNKLPYYVDIVWLSLGFKGLDNRDVVEHKRFSSRDIGE